MTINIDYETENLGPLEEIDYEELIKNVILEAIDSENCPYKAEINVVLTNNASIKKINQEYRKIDSATDVLSFPMVDYTTPSDFSHLKKASFEYFHPETGELILGDILISVDKVLEQAENFGHSVSRELAFLVAHSMLHLFGYDHVEPTERELMEEKQRKILDQLRIYR